MNNQYTNSDMNRLLDRAMERERERLKAAGHRRNVAAIIDFTSNLLSLLGHEKGARYLPVTNNLARYQSSYRNALQRYNDTLRDYKGAIAGGMFRKRLAANSKILPKAPERPVGSIRNNSITLSSGELKNTILKNNKIPKANNYVFSKY